MSVKIDLSGLNKLKENVEKLGGSRQVPLSELLPPAFVSSHSKYPDVDAFLAAVGVTNAEEFKALPQEELDAFVVANTEFETWHEMVKAGGAGYVKSQIEKGLKG